MSRVGSPPENVSCGQSCSFQTHVHLSALSFGNVTYSIWMPLSLAVPSLDGHLVWPFHRHLLYHYAREPLMHSRGIIPNTRRSRHRE